MRSIVTLSHKLLLLLLILLVVGAPLAAQPPPDAPPTAPAPPASTPSPAATPPASSEEGPADVAPTSEATPAGTPTPSVESDIEDLYAPDLPAKKTDRQTPAASDEPKSTEPVLYISDTDNGRIVVMQGIDGEGFTSVGLPGYGLGRFLRPAQVWVDYAARLYIADSGNNRIVRIDQNSVPSWTEVGGLSEPLGVAVDGSGVYVSDTKSNRVVVYEQIVNDAKVKEVLTHPQLKRPRDLWIDATGALYICCGEDPPGGKLLKTWMEKGLDGERRRWVVFEGEGLTGSRFLPASVITQKAGLKLLDVSGQRLVSMQDITGKRLKEDKFRGDPRWRLSRPTGMAVDEKGRIFIADSGNDRILELNAEGSVTGEFMILEDDPGTLLANPTSIFIYSPAPPPPPREEEDEKGKGKGKGKPKKPVEDDLEFDSGY